MSFNTSGVVSANVTANGSYAPDGISAEYRNPFTGAMGQIIMNKRNYLTTRSVSLSDLQGNWSARNIMTGLSTPARITGNGSLTATDNFGCVLNGQITIPNFERNILDLSLTITGCSEISGTFTGNGIYDEGQDLLILTGWDGFDEAGVYTLTRN